MTRLARRRQQPLPLLAARWFLTVWLTTRRRGWLALGLWLAYWGWTSVNFALGTPVGLSSSRFTVALTLMTTMVIMTGLWLSRAGPAFIARRQQRQRRRLCTHPGAVAVKAGGETVGHLCLGCDQQLPADWTEPKPPRHLEVLRQPPENVHSGMFPGSCPSCKQRLWCLRQCECDVCLYDKKWKGY